MNSLRSTLQAEIIKYKSKTNLLFLLLPMALAGLMALQLQQMTTQDPSRGNWAMFLQMTCAFWGAFLFPPFVIFWTTHVMTMERGKWKMLLVQGRSHQHFLLAKAAVLLAFFTLQSLVLLGGTFLLGHLLDLTGPVPAARSLLILQSVPAALPILALQCLVCSYARGYLIPIIPGLVGHFISLLGIQFQLGRFFPWSFVLEFLQIRGAAAQTGWLYLSLAVLMGILLLWLTCAGFRKRFP